MDCSTVQYYKPDLYKLQTISIYQFCPAGNHVGRVPGTAQCMEYVHVVRRPDRHGYRTPKRGAHRSFCQPRVGHYHRRRADLAARAGGPHLHLLLLPLPVRFQHRARERDVCRVFDRRGGGGGPPDGSRIGIFILLEFAGRSVALRDVAWANVLWIGVCEAGRVVAPVLYMQCGDD